MDWQNDICFTPQWCCGNDGVAAIKVAFPETLFDSSGCMFRWIHTWTCWRPCPILVEPLRQLIKESTNQSIHPSINQSTNQPTNHPDRSIQFSSIQSKWSQSDHQIIRSSATCTSPPPQIFVHSKPLADRPVLKSFDIIAMTPKKAHQAKCPNSAVFSTTYCFQNYCTT